MVTIVKKMMDGTTEVIYETEQRNLFKKYRDKREKSMKEIEAAVAKNA
eukprot:CAMPEP_0181310214 /NCGR_PEP_ID=MMETSP1101-20121128/12464_1 /TAXON_ID=46948 /ORGANISM="Rhodomonas abbreviata, Strain Caron Lab Isolate" /LENGTH=47 /DNA_ID= /DNA_START= /DNA_END= /DNA_ORIENTATION=